MLTIKLVLTHIKAQAIIYVQVFKCIIEIYHIITIYMLKNWRKIMIYILIAVILITIDQYSKYLAEVYLKSIGTIPLIKDVFHLTYARNTGAAFSILQNKQTFLIIITSIVVVLIIFYLIKNFKKGNVLLNMALVFIISGALGNLIDRIRLNYVTDFFDFTLINFAIFNFADIFVVFGTILFSYLLLYKDIKI